MPRKTGKRPRSLFNAWSAVARRIRKANRVLLLLDFDGTLVGFTPRPEEVRLDNSARRLLSRLARHPRISLGFISGRRRADLRRRLSVRGARYWGLHGWEDHAGKQLNHDTRKVVLRTRKLLSEKVRALRGVWVEDKQASFVLHFRAASPHDARRARAAAQSVLNSSAQPLRMLAGNNVREFLPAELTGKGVAVEGIAAAFPADTLIVYVGDDTTDEAAFAAVRRGLTIRVGSNSRTRARYRVNDPSEVREFLERLEKIVAPVSPMCGVRWTPSESRNRTPPAMFRR